MTISERRQRGIQLVDFPEELPHSLRRQAHAVLTRMNSLGVVRVYLASTHHTVPDSVRGKWMVDEGLGYPALPVTVRQWTYRFLLMQTIATQP